MFKTSILCYLFVFISVIISADDDSEEEINKVVSLCERPIINAADRMTNGTVRLYRGKYFWTLNGLPEASGSLDGPHELPFTNMGEIFRNNTVVTLLGGTDRGKTVKTDGKNYWLWDDKGSMKTDATGISHNRFPTGGFEAAFHDGNMDDPTLIGFKGIKSYYFSTRYRVWTIDNKPSGYVGGKFNETFPIDLSAAFTFPAVTPEDGYIAYFFKRDKYCKRTKILKSGKDCDEWLQNKALFGCDGQTKELKISKQSPKQELNARQSASVDTKNQNESENPKESESKGVDTTNGTESKDENKSGVTEQLSTQQTSSTDPSTTPNLGLQKEVSVFIAIILIAIHLIQLIFNLI